MVYAWDDVGRMCIEMRDVGCTRLREVVASDDSRKSDLKSLTRDLSSCLVEQSIRGSISHERVHFYLVFCQHGCSLS